MLNTHFYDGKIINELPIVENLTIAEKQQCGKDLIQSCLHINPKALYYLNAIVNDIGTINNIDHTNHINADNLICLCWMHRNNDIFIKELEIQLLDMETGFCPQGRTHRLYQIIAAFNS